MRLFAFVLVAVAVTVASKVMGVGSQRAVAVATESGGGWSDTRDATASDRQPVFTIIDEVQYPVEGYSAAELLASMQARAPEAHGTRYFGLTETRIEFRYRRVETARGCRLEDIRVDLGVVITLPEWTPPRDVSALLRRDWRRFADALRHHEDGHRVLAEHGAIRLYEALRVLREPTCDGIDATARRIASTLDAQVGREQEHYDDQTGHGRTQGARWPIR